MGLIFVTGISGSGKSEVLKELRSRGFEAYGTDEDGIAAFHDRRSGAKLENPPEKAEDRTPEWRTRYVWRMSSERVEALTHKAGNGLIFLCGVAENEGEVWDLFEQVFALAIDTDTLVKRISTRTGNNFGKVQHEMDSILEWQSQTEAAYRKFGHITIDATQPVDKVVDDLLAQVGTVDASIRSARLELRPLVKTDRSWIDALYGDQRVTSGFGMAAFSPSQLDAKMEQLIGSWAQGGFAQFLVIERETESVTGLGGIRPTADPNVGEIGYVFLPDWWGKGIASEAIEMWVKWGFEELKLAAIVAVGVGNPASVRALEKAGFVVTDEGGRLKNLQLMRSVSAG